MRRQGLAHTYSAFGLRIGSAIPLPELAEAPRDERAPDVTIALGRLPATLPGGVDLQPHMQVAPESFQLNAPRARYGVFSGARVVIDPDAAAPDSEIRLYLLGAVMGALCMHRRLLPLHAAVIDDGDGGIALAGPSGSGKSTLVAQMLTRGWSVMADDLCVIDTRRRGAPEAMPGLRRIKLWADSLGLAAVSGSGLARVAEGVEKYSVPLANEVKPRPLRRLYVMRGGASPAVQILPLRGPEVLSAVLESIFNWGVGVAMGRADDLFAQCADVSSSCAVFELRYTLDAARPTLLADAIESHVWG